MKTSYITFFVFLISNISFSQKEVVNKNNLKDLGIYGKAKSIKVISYKAKKHKNELIPDKIKWIEHLTFNENGDLLTSKNINSKMQIVSSVQIAYNQIGQILEKKTYDLDSMLTQRQMFSYDSLGACTEEKTFNHADSLVHFVSRKINYNQEGRIIEKADANEIVLYSYNTQGELTEIKHLDGNRNVLSTCTYDEFGHCATHNSDYTYDKKGNRIAWDVKNPTGTLHYKYVYVFDEMGNQTEESYFGPNGNLIDKTTYEYDNFQNKIRQIEYKPNGKVKYTFLYKFSYDNEGNWIKKQYDGDFKVKSIIVREIEYY